MNVVQRSAGWIWKEGGGGGEGRGRVDGECVLGMGEEGRPLWAGVIREPFMGETITGCDSGAQPKSPLQPFASHSPSQPPNYWTVCSAMHKYTHIHTPIHPPSSPVHIWPSLICCIRKRQGWVKGREEGEAKKWQGKKTPRTDTVHKFTTDTHKCLHTSSVLWCLEPDSEGFYLRFGLG